jgi:uncharacterized membrane protein
MAQSILSFRFQRRPWFSWLGDVLLAAIVSGPLAAPFLVMSGVPLLMWIGELIYGMGRIVCPQPQLGMPMATGHLMSVCVRCYGTVLGLFAMRIWFVRDHGRSVYWLDQYGLLGFGLTFTLCMAYPIELALQGFDWWPISNPRMFIFGAIAGLGLGAYIMPLFHGYLREK